MGSVNFQIEGEFVCDLARVWFWDEGREYSKCEELLLSCLVTDQITLEEEDCRRNPGRAEETCRREQFVTCGQWRQNPAAD